MLPTRTTRPRAAVLARRLALPGLLASTLAACAVGPDYVRPAMDVPPAYKEAGPWKTAEPRPARSGEGWWTAYGDATLDGLMQDADRANQSLRVAEAQYREARALADQARASLFPTLNAEATLTRERVLTPSPSVSNTGGIGLAASWEPDLWGGVRRSVEAGEATAQASADQLAGARLSIETTLAQDYVQLRITDRLRDLYAATTAAYAKALALTQAQHAAGVALRSDVALAQSQLKTAQAQAIDLDAARALLEHAIAVLTGRAPAQFGLAPMDAQHPFDPAIPVTPAGLPSELLEHRPDVAAAERQVAAANANIGVARAAYFPALTLDASGAATGATLSALFDTPGFVWSIGATLAETVFDGGARKARNAQAVAAWDAAVATYKQTVLSSFQQVEDELGTLRILDQEAGLQREAVQASRLAETLALRQYRAGTASYLSVVTAQALALGNERADVQLRGRQLAASIALVAATGGGWDATRPGASPPAPATIPPTVSPPASPSTPQPMPPPVAAAQGSTS